MKGKRKGEWANAGNFTRDEALRNGGGLSGCDCQSQNRGRKAFPGGYDSKVCADSWGRLSEGKKWEAGVCAGGSTHETIANIDAPSTHRTKPQTIRNFHWCSFFFWFHHLPPGLLCVPDVSEELLMNHA